MLAASLDPLTFNRDAGSWSGVLEAFAFTKLATYNQQTFSGANALSFTRAYGAQQVLGIQRGPGVAPAAVMANFPDAGSGRMLIAIEGAQSWSDLALLWANGGTVQGDTYQGRIYRAFRDSYLTTWQKFVNGWTLDTLLTNTSFPVTLAGHSLGGAVAELIAWYIRRNYPAHPVNVVTFGCPKIGTPAWYRGLRPYANVHRLYCGHDPIESLPFYSPPLLGLAQWDEQQNYGTGLMAQNPDSEHYTFQGERTSNAETQRIYNPARAILDWPNSNDPGRPWYYHTLNAYRYMLTQVAQTLPYNERIRFQFLDYPDNNTWGTFYRPGGGIVGAMLDLADPAPAAVEKEFVNPSTPEPAVAGLPPVNYVPEVLPEGRAPIRGQFGPSRVHRTH